MSASASDFITVEFANKHTSGTEINDITYSHDSTNTLKERAYSRLVSADLMDDSKQYVERKIELTTDNGNSVARSQYMYFGDTAYFSYITVSEPFRNHGIGTQLASHTLEKLRSDGVSEVYLLPKSAEAVTIFKNKLGFRESADVDYLVKSL